MRRRGWWGNQRLSDEGPRGIDAGQQPLRDGGAQAVGGAPFLRYGGEVRLDALRMQVDSLSQALNAARQRLVSLTEIRPVDVDVASAELDEAVRSEASARADVETSVIRSPIDGRVIKIHTKPGEQVRDQGVMELAPTEPMYVVAEVAESDIARVRVGQRAKAVADALPASVEGTVERISLKVLQNQLMPVDPARFSDARVVDVWIKIDDGRLVADLIHMRVDVVIQP